MGKEQGAGEGQHPPPLAGGRTVTHLVGDLERKKKKKKLRERPFSLPSPAALSPSRPGLTLELASSTGSLVPSMAGPRTPVADTSRHAPRLPTLPLPLHESYGPAHAVDVRGE